MTEDQYVVRLRAVVAAEFELSGMRISDTYEIAGKRMREMLPDLPDGLEWQLTDLHVHRKTEPRPELTSPLAELVRDRMRALGLSSSRQVAVRTGEDSLSHTTVNLIISGKQRDPGLATRRKLARALDMPDDWLY